MTRLYVCSPNLEMIFMGMSVFRKTAGKPPVGFRLQAAPPRYIGQV